MSGPFNPEGSGAGSPANVYGGNLDGENTMNDAVNEIVNEVDLDDTTNWYGVPMKGFKNDPRGWSILKALKSEMIRNSNSDDSNRV
jgi:hypothetical protein